MTAQHGMLAWYLRNYSGDLDNYCKGTLYGCDFSGGVRTSCPPPLDTHMDNAITLMKNSSCSKVNMLN